MALRKRPLTVRPSGVNQRVEPTQLPIGKLTAALDVHQPTPGELVKRDGHTPITRATSTGGVLAGGRGLASNGSTLIQQTTEGIYFKGTDSWVRKAPSRSVWAPVPTEVMRFGFRPSSVVVGNLIYYFSADHGVDFTFPLFGYAPGDAVELRSGESRPSWWTYRVVDKNTGVEIVGTTTIDTVRGYMAKPVVIGANVWLFVGPELTGVTSPTEARTISTVKFVSTTPTVAPVITTYYDAGANAVINGWDVFVAQGVAYFAAAGIASGGGVLGVASKLDTATGAVAAAPGTVTLAGILSSAYPVCISWFENITSGANFYFAICSEGYAATVHSVDVTTLTISGTAVLAGVTGTHTLIAGYKDTGTGNVITYMSYPYQDVSNESHTALERYEHTNAGTLVSYLPRRNTNIAAKPFQYDSRWYVIGHFDDAGHGQNAYYLIDGATMEILGRSIYGEAGDLTQLARGIVAFPDPTVAPLFGQYAIGHWVAPTPRVDGTTVTITLNAYDRGQYVSRDIKFIFDTRFQITAVGDDNEIVFPGGWPLHAAHGSVTEYPTQYPHKAPVVSAVTTAGGSMDAGAYGVCYVWSFRAPNGDIYESRPSPIATVTLATGNHINISYDTFTFTNTEQLNDAGTGGPQGPWSIDFYVTSPVPVDAPGGPDEIEAAEAAAALQTMYYQCSTPNVTNATGGTIDPPITTLRTERALYSSDGAELPNDPPPPFKTVNTWRKRMMIAYGNEIWPSKEKRFGQGYSFSAVMAFVVPGGDEEITAHGPVSDTHYAIFRRNGIWVTTGNGPDGTRGHNQYQPVRLDYADGCTNQASLVTTPRGLMYQSANDGRIYLLTLGLERVPIDAGVYDYKDNTITGAVYDADNGRVIFLTETV